MRSSLFSFASLALMIATTACRHPSSAVATPAEAIANVLAEDEKIGAARDLACADAPISEAVTQYVAAVDALDFSRCPDDFTAAFREHRDAWAATIPFFTPFDTLRGEMHELFAVIEEVGDSTGQAAFAAIQKPIWDTWSKVDSLARKYGSAKDGE